MDEPLEQEWRKRQATLLHNLHLPQAVIDTEFSLMWDTPNFVSRSTQSQTHADVNAFRMPKLQYLRMTTNGSGI